MLEVKPERTHWRDEALSERHRRWGVKCPAVDIDFLLLEFDYGKPSALVEYKNEHAKPQYPSHPSYQALIELGNRANIPVLACRYASDFSWWKVTPLNEKAKEYCRGQKTVTEREWVKLLYKLRGYNAPQSLLDSLNIEI